MWNGKLDESKAGIKIVGRNVNNLTYAMTPPEWQKDIKKKWQERTEELNKKDLHNPDNHEDVMTLLEPDILECEVK